MAQQTFGRLKNAFHGTLITGARLPWPWLGPNRIQEGACAFIPRYLAQFGLARRHLGRTRPKMALWTLGRLKNAPHGPLKTGSRLPWPWLGPNWLLEGACAFIPRYLTRFGLARRHFRANKAQNGPTDIGAAQKCIS